MSCPGVGRRAHIRLRRNTTYITTHHCTRIISFFDFSCGYHVRANSQNKNVRVAHSALGVDHFDSFRLRR